MSLAGIAKGSGMIEPDMATMLSFLVTDALVSPAYLRGVLRRVVDQTFNRVSVDGEGSTSDSVIALAGGAARNPRLTSRRQPGAEAFEEVARARGWRIEELVLADGSRSFLHTRLLRMEREPATVDLSG